MKIAIHLAAAIAATGFLTAEESSPDMSGLEKAAMDFVAAYGAQDATAISQLFTEDAEMTDLYATDLITGREAIKARYDNIFAADEVADIAIQVDSVRLVAPNLAIEDGTVHLTPPGDESEPPRSTTYTAVLLKNDAGTWQIASTRTLNDVTDAAGQLADLAKMLNGEWTAFNLDGVRFDLAIGWDASGKFIKADTLTTAPDAEPQEGSIRIGWNAARKSIVSWMFDAEGGANQGIWTPTEDGWLIRTEGTSADGETITANQELTTDGSALIWTVTNRVVDGEKEPDSSLRLVPPAPELEPVAN